MPRQIGWSVESNLLYGIKKALSCECIPSTNTTTSTTTTIAP
jgi:hypothetical protein